MLALAGQGLIYALSILLARRLGVEGFDDYAVASAVFMLLASIAPLGSEKYALRIVPVLLERGDWGLTRGYLYFAIGRSLRAAVLMAGAAAAVALALGDALQDGTRRTIVVAMLALPLGALVHLGLETLTALGREFVASALFRIAVPGTALACVALLAASGLLRDGTLAIAAWGPAWLLALVAMVHLARRSLPSAVRQATRVDQAPMWRAESRPFFYYRLAIGLLGQSGLIALALMQAPAMAVGAYAAALGTAGLGTVLATATNRAYGRRLSLLLERRDLAGIQRLRVERLRWMLPCVALFLGASLLYGGEVLRLFRPEFAEQGLPALRILSVGVAVAVLLALAPTYLKFRRRKAATYATVSIAAVAQLLLLVWLVPRAGATGAAAAYVLSMCGMYAAFAWMGHRELRSLQRTWRAGGEQPPG